MGRRPPHVKPPVYLAKSPPVPEPGPPDREARKTVRDRDPTRYGDWELKGIAIDF